MQDSVGTKVMKKPYPLRLNNAPIVEAIVEIRFDTSTPPDAVFGILYSNLISDYPTHKQMPIMQLPADIRLNDLNLQYQVYYQFRGKERPLIIGIGPKVVSISYVKYDMISNKDYPGWRAYIAGEATRIIRLAKEKLTNTKIERIGIRYQDFFESMDIFNGIEPKFNFPDRTIQSLMIKTAISEKDMIHDITISNSASINIQNGDAAQAKNGSIIDIDTSINELQQEILIDNIENLLTDVHDANKNLFYEILTEEFVNTLGPVGQIKDV